MGYARAFNRTERGLKVNDLYFNLLRYEYWFFCFCISDEKKW